MRCVRRLSGSGGGLGGRGRGGGGILNSPTTTGWSISILCKSPSHGEAGGVQRACEVVSARRRPSRAPPAASIYLSANRHADTSGEANTFDRRRHESKVGCCQTPEFQRGRNGPRANSHSQKFAVLPSALVLTSSWMVPVDPAMLEVHTHCNHVMWQRFKFFLLFSRLHGKKSGSNRSQQSSRGFLRRR